MSTFQVKPAFDSSHSLPSQRKAFFIKCGLLIGGFVMLTIVSIVIGVVVTKVQDSSENSVDIKTEGLDATLGSVSKSTHSGSGGQELDPSVMQNTLAGSLLIGVRSFVGAHWRVVVPVAVLVCILVAVGVSLVVYFEQQRHAELAMQAVEERNQELMDLEKLQQSQNNKGSGQASTHEDVPETKGLPWMDILEISLGIHSVLTCIFGVYCVLFFGLDVLKETILVILFAFILGHSWLLFLVIFTLIGKFFNKLSSCGFPSIILKIISVPLLLIYSVLLILATPFLAIMGIFISLGVLKSFWTLFIESWKQLQIHEWKYEWLGGEES